MPTNIAENLARLEDEIEAACRRANRPRSQVQLMAVSKLHPIECIREAAAAGLTLFGENRVQEWQQKSAELAELNKAGLNLEVHLIGHLQSNKAAKAAEIFSAVDTVDSLRLAERLNEAAQRLNRTIPILLEIKLSPEESKTGLDLGRDPNALAELLDRLPSLPNLQLRGLMTVPPWSDDPETARPYFAQLRQLRERLATERPALDFSQLSMGMSGDFSVAIEEGSTCIRIGTALFGRRSPRA